MMNFYQRAIRYVLRQRIRSLLLSGILFIFLFVCLLGAMLVRTTHEIIDLVAINANANIAVFDLNHQNKITSIALATFLEVENIRAVNRSNQLDVIIADEINVGSLEPVFGVGQSLLGIDNLIIEGPFFLQDKHLVAGHLELAADEIIIFAGMAELNDWRIGSKIPFSYADNEVKYGRVAGFYQLGEISARLDNSIIYVSPDFINEMKGYESYSSVILYVTNPSIIEQTAAEIGSLLDQDNFTWGTVDFLYRQMRSQLDSTNELVTTMLIVSISISTMIVVLLLSLWTRERKKETALLLALGESKILIFGQRLVEIFSLFLIIFIALTLGLRILSPRLGELFYQTQALENYEAFINGLQFQLTLTDILITGGVGMIILLSAVLISLIPIVRLMPNTIFSAIE